VKIPYLTLIRIKENEEKIREKCEKINEVDATFKFSIERGILSVESETREQAYKRGYILCKKYFKDLGDFGFEVIRGKE
jgi:hypothetical protein